MFWRSLKHISLENRWKLLKQTQQFNSRTFPLLRIAATVFSDQWEGIFQIVFFYGIHICDLNHFCLRILPILAGYVNIGSYQKNVERNIPCLSTQSIPTHEILLFGREFREVYFKLTKNERFDFSEETRFKLVLGRIKIHNTLERILK